MKRLILLLALTVTLASASLLAQKNEVSVGALANLNGGSFITLSTQGNIPLAVSYKSSMGGVVSYGYWFMKDFAVRLRLEANPSEGILFADQNMPDKYNIALTRYETGLLGVERFHTKYKIEPYITGGPCWVLTHGAQPGWSQDSGICTGGGVDYCSGRWCAGVSMLSLMAKQGCYGDPTCKASMAPATDTGANVRVYFGK